MASPSSGPRYPSNQVQQMIEAVESLRSDQSIPGMRNLLSRSSYVKNFATSGIAFEIAKEILGTEPLPVKRNSF